MKFQIGVDEVGLGAIAGPLCVTAVCVLEVRVEELRSMTHNRDSKMLSAKKREAIAARLTEAPWVYSATVTIPPEEIDRAIAQYLDAIRFANGTIRWSYLKSLGLKGAP